MNTRLKQFIAAENISQSQFADTIKVVRASVSHVLSGRNNPGYDFIKAIMNAYPTLNIEWLILGKGKMYKESTESPSQYVPSPEPLQEPSLFNDDGILSFPPADDNFPPADFPVRHIEDKTSSNQLQTIVKQRKATKVVIFFDDGTFQEM